MFIKTIFEMIVLKKREKGSFLVFVVVFITKRLFFKKNETLTYLVASDRNGKLSSIKNKKNRRPKTKLVIIKVSNQKGLAEIYLLRANFLLF